MNIKIIKRKSTLEVRHLYKYLALKYMLDFYDENCNWLNDNFGVYTNEDNTNAIVMIKHHLFISSKCNNDFINDFFKEVIDQKKIQELGIVFLVYDNEYNVIDTKTLSSFKPYIIDRLLYKFDKYKDNDNIDKLPNVITIKEAYDKKLQGLDLITDEVISTGTFENMNEYLKNDLGYTIEKDNCVQGFCTIEYPSKNSIAFGILVNDDLQRKGYGKCMAKNLVKDIKKMNSEKDIFWDCFKENISSSKTAEASGFKLINEYKVIFLPLRKKDE